MLQLPISIWLFAAALIGAVACAFYAVAAGRESYGTGVLGVPIDSSIRELSLNRSGAERFRLSLGRMATGLTRRVTPSRSLHTAGHRIARAGLTHKLTADRWIAGKVMAALVVLVSLVTIGVMTGSSITLLLGFAAAILVFFLPELYLSRQGEARGKRMQRALADVVDQILISVEAGASLDMALRRVASRGTGPLEEELNRTLQDIALGMGRQDALMSFADRTDVPDLRELIVSLARSEELGLSIGRVLRIQAEEIRNRRRMRAEEAALKVPVKMVFPLVLCILPCLMAVIMGPAIVRITQDIL